MDDEPILLDEFDHIGIQIEICTLSLFTFDDQTNDQLGENISQEDMVTHTHHIEQFEDDEKIEFQVKFEN